MIKCRIEVEMRRHKIQFSHHCQCEKQFSDVHVVSIYHVCVLGLCG